MLLEQAVVDSRARDGEVILALVPIKDLRQAKQRLAGILSPGERRDLCLAMLHDVLTALTKAKLLRDILVYSADDDALALAAGFGIATARESRSDGHSQAVTAALPRCLARGATSVVTIPVDTPLLLAEDVDALVGFRRAVALPRPSAIMVPSRDGTGTNSLFLTPPNCLTPLFGPDSLAKHRRQAERLGIAYRQFELPRLALDVDSPDDLLAFLAAAEDGNGTGTRTYQHLTRTGIARRCRIRVG